MFGHGFKNHKRKRFTQATGTIASTAALMLALTGCEPDGVEKYDPELAWNGYTYFSTSSGDLVTYVIDMEGNVVKTYDCSGFPAKILPDASIICSTAQERSVDLADIVQKSPEGEILWRFNEYIDGSARQHHDFQVGGNNPVGYYAPGLEIIGPADGGNVLILATEELTSEEQDMSLGNLRNDRLYEVDTAGNILWEWSALEHVDQMGFSKSAIVNIYLFAPMDWLHFNAASYLGPNKWYDQYGDYRFHPDNIMISSPLGNWLAIIDKVSGDIVWRMGPDFSPGMPGSEFGGFAFAHMGHMIPQGLPGEGNILMYDNGGYAGYGDQVALPALRSRALEINPMDFTLEWKSTVYTYSPVMGSVQRLPNGNTMMLSTLSNRIIEVTPDNVVAWEYNLDFSSYRAYRIPAEWIDNLE